MSSPAPVQPYRLIIQPAAERDTRRIPKKDLHRIIAAIRELVRDPRPPNSIKVDEKTYRIRQGDYRIIYMVDDSIRTIYITKVRHRSKAYR